MEFNRRELLKYFGIGATIAPVVGGLPKIEAAANLIEVPQVEKIAAGDDITFSSSMPQLNSNPHEVRVSIKDKSGMVWHFQGRSWITSCRFEVIDVTSYEGSRNWKREIQNPHQVEWTFSGVQIYPREVHDWSSREK